MATSQACCIVKNWETGYWSVWWTLWRRLWMGWCDR